MSAKRAKNYVGVIKPGKAEVFKNVGEPSAMDYGGTYLYVIGPFVTKRGADFMATYGWNNPHLQHVADAERLAKEAAISN